MKKLTIAGAVASAIAILVVGSIIPATSQVPAQRTTIELFDPNPTDFTKSFNEGAKGFSAGDWEVFKDTNLDPETCEPAATLLGQFQLVKPAGPQDGYFLAHIGLQLADGKLIAEGAGKFSEFEAEDGAKFAITGGTGTYKDVRGEATLVEDQEMCELKGSLVTLDLLTE